MTETAQNRSGTTLDPLPPAEVDHDAMYVALRRLVSASRTLLHHVETGSADMHRDVPLVRRAVQEAEGLLYPALLPQAPDDAVVVFGRSVRKGDQVWSAKNGQWSTVIAHQVGNEPGGAIRLVLSMADSPREAWIVVRPDEPVAIIEGDS